jgi:hypothetical protein
MKNDLSDLLDALNQIKNENPDLDSTDLVDIITFCDSPEYLNLPATNFNLFLSQKVILKSFYMGSRGNETLKFTKEEMEWINSIPEEFVDEECGIKYHTNIKSVIKKLQDREAEGNYFSELNLVLGRRASKTILSSIISAYEVYKLLSINGGDPHKFYNIPYGSEIVILNVALSREQATKLFSEVCNRLRNSEFFKGKIEKDTNLEVRLFTKYDLEQKKLNPGLNVHGSLSIKCGSSNIDAMRGSNAILILFDEMAFFDDTGQVSGRKLYEALKPSLAKFHKKGEGRLVEISSPGVTSGIFYERHKAAEKEEVGKKIISWQLPTWLVNFDISYDDENLRLDRMDNPDAFAVEFGAQFSKSGYVMSFFPEMLIERCIRPDLEPHSSPKPKMNYFMHIDPANGGDRYAAVLAAMEPFTDNHGKKKKRIYVANIYIWEPEPGVGLNFQKIDEEVASICKKFNVLSVTYDQWNSVHSVQYLKARGIRCHQTAFNNTYKNKIYRALKEKMASDPQPEIFFYYDSRLLLELKHLKCRETKRGLSFSPDKNAPVSTDDIVDCVAGVCAEGTDAIRQPLPTPAVAQTGLMPTAAAKSRFDHKMNRLRGIRQFR